MSDPLRLSATHRRSLTAAMLDSARDDDPPASARQRALVAFGAGTGAILTAGVAEGGAGVAAGTAGTTAVSGASVAATKLVTWIAVAKWAGGGAVLAVCTAAAVASVPPRGQATRVGLPSVVSRVSVPSPEITAPMNAPAIAAPPVVATVDVPSIQVVPEMASRGQQVAPSRAARQPAPSPEPEPATEPTAHPPDESLLGEVGWLDRASTSIRSGDVENGLQMLDEYKVRFPSAVLAPESQVLRIEALVRKGDRASAARLGEAFLARTPRSALAARVRSLLASTQKEQTP